MGQFFIGKRFEFTELTFDRTWQKRLLLRGTWQQALIWFGKSKVKIQIIRNDNWDYRSTLYLLYVFSGLVSARFTVFSPTPVREVLALFNVKGSLT
jgi:hypothetical protein